MVIDSQNSHYFINLLEAVGTSDNYAFSDDESSDPIESILENTDLRLHQIISFSERAFFLTDNDSLHFNCRFVEPSDKQQQFESLLDKAIDEGSFALALKYNRAVMMSVDNQTVVLNALATRYRSYGMFFGVLPDQEAESYAVSLKVLSVILANAAHALESYLDRSAIQDSLAKTKAALQQLKQAQSQLVQQEKLATIGQLAAGIAHEINNPVGFIKSNLNTLKSYIANYQTVLNAYETGADAEAIAGLKAKDWEFMHDDIAELLTESLDGTKRIVEIVNSLRSFSHGDPKAKAPIDINTCIEAALKIVWNQLKYTCTVHKDLQAKSQVLAHQGQLVQVLTNLLVNAEHAIEKPGEITVKSFEDDDQVYISVRDNGCGIPEENLESLFNPFFTTKPVGKGTGLGLSISYGIIEAHQGTISVDSEPDVGTCFTIALPKHE